MQNACILGTVSGNKFGQAALIRPQPFGGASSERGLSVLRSNNDFRYMPRGFADASTLSQSFRCDVSQLAVCARAARAQIRPHAVVQRMTMSVFAIHVVANIVDYYITKYSAKPMEQLQNLVTQYALGLRRLDMEEKLPVADATPGHAHVGADNKALSRNTYVAFAAFGQSAQVDISD